MIARAFFCIATLLIAACAANVPTTSDTREPPRVLEAFENLSAWQANHTDDVSASIRASEGIKGKSLRMDFDFASVNGYATARRALPLDLPANYEIAFWIRGDAPVNALQMKLSDVSGENVWWLNRPDFTFPHEWQQIRIKKRQLEFAWGPTNDRVLRHSAAVEFVVSSGRGGGKGYVEIDQLTLRELPVDSSVHAQPLVSASSTGSGNAQNVVGAADRSWCSAGPAEQSLIVDFREEREFGGVRLRWKDAAFAKKYDIALSDDNRTWRNVRSVEAGNGGDDALDLPDAEARYLRLSMHAGDGNRYCLTHLDVEELAWGATPNAFMQALAKQAPRGIFPRGFVEQVYWTLVGIDGGPTPALLSEDGTLQAGKTSFSVEPFLFDGEHWISWADITARQSLRDAYLPIPSVEWNAASVQLTVTAFADGTRGHSRVFARYRLSNTTDAPVHSKLALAVRPFQVNPPMQFLNGAGGVSDIHDLSLSGARVMIDGVTRVSSLRTPDSFGASAFDSGEIAQRLRERNFPNANRAHDDNGRASGALVYSFDLAAHAAQDVDIIAPLDGATMQSIEALPTNFDAQLSRVAQDWHSKLDQVAIHVPIAAQRLADTLRTAHADILMSRDGVALRPGTRAYARSWIRDGAMIAEGLLRLGDTQAVRDYVDWYAPHQFASGKVPCCVDWRGSDPVPENDSHGELIHAVAELYRYGGDRVELQRNWPYVQAAVGYMDALRAQEMQPAANGSIDQAFHGLMPASISHEGYSAKPMHSYWDDFWALIGYNDAARLALELNLPDAHSRYATARDAFEYDFHGSIKQSMQAHAIDYLPGSVELGDFDATSSTVALSPGDQADVLPPRLLENTFERYWKTFVARRDSGSAWNDYTPYEWRVVGSFARLGWRQRAQQLIDFFFSSGARPAAWNQWAEVVGNDPRKPRFLGDMPHAWVASDFIRSSLDLFAYERQAKSQLVLASGIPTAWFAGTGVSIANLRTPYGQLSYHLQQKNGQLILGIDAGAKPAGGFAFAWPFDGSPGAVTVDGQGATWKDGEIVIHSTPAHIIMRVPTTH